jgi:hypothetical protein
MVIAVFLYKISTQEQGGAKMNTKNAISLILAILFFALAGALSTAVAGGFSNTEPTALPDHFIVLTNGSHITLVELSEAEAEKLAADLEAFGEAIYALKKEICMNSRELVQVLSASDPDLEAARTLQMEISRLKSELDLLTIEHIVQMKKILPELPPEASPAGEGRIPLEKGNAHIRNI